MTAHRALAALAAQPVAPAEPTASDDSFSFIRTLVPPEIEAKAKRRPPSRRRKCDCMDCGTELGFRGGNGHFYMVRDHVWLQAVPNVRGELCLDCLQVRLGRSLSAADFLYTPLQMFKRLYFPSGPSAEEVDEAYRQQLDEDADREIEMSEISPDLGRSFWYRSHCIR
jgi:hypothetical protein